MKKILSVLLSFAVASMLFATSVFAAEKEIDIQVDGQQVQFDTLAPIIIDDYTWAPQEALFAALGIADDFDFEQGQRINETAYVPVRILAETIGYEIRWDGATRTVTLEKAEIEGSRGYLWKVQNEGNTVYLLGSIHVAKSDMYPLHPAIEEAFEEAAYLGTEIDMSKAGTEEVQQQIFELGLYHDGTTLKEHISAETYAQLNELLIQNGLPADALDAFKPWLVETMLMTLQLPQYGYTELGIDQYFTNKAIERDIPILELESYELQLNMFNSFPAALQEASLVLTIDNYGDSTYIDALSEIWKTGNVEQMIAVIEDLKEFDEAYYNAILLDRNVGMANKVEGYLNDPDGEVFFIIAGAAHMPGEDGVVKLLQDKGFIVDQVF